jgi:uncharacterized membrane protein YtjA (UPF0391 family)
LTLGVIDKRSLRFLLLRQKKGDTAMLSWSITFLIVGLIAGLLGLSGIAGAATQIAWMLFVVFLVLFLVSFAHGPLPADLTAIPTDSYRATEKKCFHEFSAFPRRSKGDRSL